MDSCGKEKIKVVWKNGSEKMWYKRDDDLDLRKEYDIPTESEWKIMQLAAKVENLNRLLSWADLAGVPNNSQVREILGGFVTSLSQAMIQDSDSEWKRLTSMASGEGVLTPKMRFL